MSKDTSLPSLSDLLAKPQALTVGPVSILVKPMGWYQASDALEALTPALEDMPVFKAGGDVDMVSWLSWVHDHKDRVTEFAALASGQDADVIRQLSPGHIVELLFGLFEVNADFFVQSLPAVIGGLAQRSAVLKQRVAAALSSVLPTSGNTSSQMDTSSAS